MSSPITHDLLHVTTRGITIQECQRRGWNWERYGWVRSTIKFAARQFSEGVPVDKIIHWKDESKTAGHNFDCFDTFAEAMYIAATEYGIENIPYKQANHVAPHDRALILYWYEMGMSADTLASQYGLLNGTVVEEIYREESMQEAQVNNQLIPIKINQYPHSSPEDSLISSIKSDAPEPRADEQYFRAADKQQLSAA